MHEPFVLIPFDSPPKSVSRGARFWGFFRFRVRGVLGGNPSITLDLVSFSGLNRGYEMAMVLILSPKSCANLWSESGDRHLDLEELTRGLLFILRAQIFSGLTGAFHRFDQCRPQLVFCSGERPSVFPSL
jgi:hypothetical protein